MQQSTIFGLGYRRPVQDILRQRNAEIDCLEIVVEHFLPFTRARKSELAELASRTTVLPHCLGLSVGSARQPDWDYVAQVAKIAEFIEAPYVSDHLAFRYAGGYDAGHFLPLQFDDLDLSVVGSNVNQIQDRLQRKVALENVTLSHLPPCGERDFTYARFMQELVHSTGCGILLDLANLVVNEANFGGSPIKVVETIAQNGLEVLQFHLVGAERLHDRSIDSHRLAMSATELEFAQFAIDILGPRYAIIERDSNYATFDSAFNELAMLRQSGSV